MFDWYDLNPRHEATILWSAAFLLFVFVASPSIRQSAGGILKLLVQPTILVPIVGLLATIAATTIVGVTIGRKVGLWDTLPVVTASFWTFTSGFSLLINLQEFYEGNKIFVRKAKAVIGFSAAIVVFINLGVLPFWWEFSLVPFLMVLAILFAAGASLKGSRRAANVSKFLLLFYIFALVLLAIVGLVRNPGTWESFAQTFLFPIWLTLGSLVYVKSLIVIDGCMFRFSSRCRRVTAVEYGPDWPLIVDSAKLRNKHGSVWLEVDGKSYGLNGTAKTLLPKHGLTCLDICEISKDDPGREGLIEVLGDNEDPPTWKISSHRLLQDGLALANDHA